MDVTAMQKNLARDKSLSGYELLVSDTQGDGRFTISDATEIQRYIAEMPYNPVIGMPLGEVHPDTFPTEAPTEMPAFTCCACGEGFGCTIPWHIGTDYYKDGHEAYLLFAGAVLKKLGVHPAGENLSPMVEVTHGVKGDCELVHFVNGSGHFGNSYFDPAVLTNQSMTIDWPHESVCVRNLDEDGNVEYKLENKKLTITIPKLGAHACVVIKEEA